MTRLRRPLLLPRRRDDPRASLVALVVHVTLIAIVVPSLVVPIALELLIDDFGREVMPEQISFIVAAPPSTERASRASRSGGDGREATRAPAPPTPIVAPVVAPSTEPSVLPIAPRVPPAPARGVGPLVGGGGPTLGIRPSFTDRRLWLPPSDVVIAPRVPMTRADSLNEVLRMTAEAYVDSLRRADPGGRQPGDWTWERNGKKYGIDPAFIRLGDFSIPTALLALLPMNVQANPTGLERARRLSSMRMEIVEQAERRVRDDDFRAAVRALRERKERERKEAEAKRAEGVVPARF